ncbi:MAG: trypsin-like peptidase domain-containing protein [Candidatus Micrarchaeota archaeon]
MPELQKPQNANFVNSLVVLGKKHRIILILVGLAFLLTIGLALSSGPPSEETVIENALAGTITIKNDVGLGSGVIIGGDDTETWILTNRHVVDPDEDGSGAPNQIVSMTDGRTYYPSEILIPPYDDIDLAYVTITKVTAPVALIDYQYTPKTGEKVVAVGSPLGLENTVTTGIVSAVRYITSETGYKTEVIQTSAPINHGNSGGGLFSLKTGNLLGINSFGPPEEAKSQGIGFAYSIKLFGDLPKNNWRSLDLTVPSVCRIDWKDAGLEKIGLEKCSQYQPWWCNPSTRDVEEKADLCGCPDGYSASGDKCVAASQGEQTLLDKTVTLESDSLWYYGGDAASLSTSETIHYIVSSSLSVNINIVPSKQAFRDALQGLDYNAYSFCAASSVYTYDEKCTLDKNGGIIITNDNAASAVIHVVVKIAG